MPTTELIREYCAKFGALETSGHVSPFMESVLESHRFQLYSVATFPVNEDRVLDAHNLANNWPGELVEAFQESGLVDRSPMLPLLRSTMLPISMRHDDGSSAKFDIPDVNRATELMLQFGISYSVIFPRYDFRGDRAAVILAGNRDSLSIPELLELNMICTFVFERLCIFQARQEGGEPPLSERELECLRWSAEGKTSGEISVIMSLSEHTINYYLLSAARKLDAVNRVQAVAQSIREGWI